MKVLFPIVFLSIFVSNLFCQSPYFLNFDDTLMFSNYSDKLLIDSSNHNNLWQIGHKKQFLPQHILNLMSSGQTFTTPSLNTSTTNYYDSFYSQLSCKGTSRCINEFIVFLQL